VIEWVPGASEDVMKVPLPALRFTVANKVAPSKNFTLPVADAGDTVAVKLTGLLRTDGLALDVSEVDVGACVTPSIRLDVAGLKFESPL
jgi:hypothetical protein